MYAPHFYQQQPAIAGVRAAQSYSGNICLINTTTKRFKKMFYPNIANNKLTKIKSNSTNKVRKSNVTIKVVLYACTCVCMYVCICTRLRHELSIAITRGKIRPKI